MQTRRKAAVSGQFYPSDGDELTAFIEAVMSCGTGGKRDVMGAVVPHAGYIYSGRTAGAVYSSLFIPEEVVLLGPTHRGSPRPASLWCEGEWETPLGDVTISEALAESILNASDVFCCHPGDHSDEHSIEVQLPFLLYARPQVKIVPITISADSLEAALIIGKGIAEGVARFGKNVLILASSDMNHYEPDEITRRKDHRAIACMEKLDPEALLRTVEEHRISMCGSVPSAAMMTAVRQSGASRGELIDYSTSGDTEPNHPWVVGYAGMVFY